MNNLGMESKRVKLNLLKSSCLLLLTAIITACGGGSDSSNSNTNTPVIDHKKPETLPKPQPESPTKPDLDIPTKPSVEYTVLSGTAHDDGQHFNFKVTAKCMDNTGFKSEVISDGNAKWQGQVDRTKLPCKLQINSEGQSYHAYADRADRLININPFTDLSIALASNQSPQDWFASQHVFNFSQLEQASQEIRKALIKKNYLLEENVLLLSDPIHYGVSYYKALEMFKTALKSDKHLKDYTALVTAVKQADLTRIPIAPEQYQLLNVQYSACSGVAYMGKTQLLTHCGQNLIEDFKTTKYKQENGESCLLQKVGHDVSLTSAGKSYSVKLNQEADDKITNHYPIMNTLLITEGNQRLEVVFQYDHVFAAAGYQIDQVGNMINVIKCS